MRGIAVFGLVLGLVGCTRQRLVGEVVDAVGKPLAGAMVEVEGSTFSTLTDDRGRYTLEYRPGELVLRVHAGPYLEPSRLSLSLPRKKTLTLAPIALTPAEPELLRVEAGRFLMGEPQLEGTGESYPIEAPQHEVRLSKSFFLGKYEVTQGQWAAVTGEHPSHFRPCGLDCPVEQVSWFEAVAYCNRLSELRGLARCYALGEGEAVFDASCDGYRLPTEAEWEYAARAGTVTTLYSGPMTTLGENHSPELDLVAWYGGNSEVLYPEGVDCTDWPGKQYPSERCGPQRVGTKRPNAWGFLDLLGNVGEWTQDWLEELPVEPAVDPSGPSKGEVRVVRGGSWYSLAGGCTCAGRQGEAPRERNHHLGFRLARTRPYLP